MNAQEHQEWQRKAQEEMLRQQRAQQQMHNEMVQAQQRAQERQNAIDTDSKQKYAIIAAVDLQRGFSKNGEIPWNYPEDLEWFKQHTATHICVMGKTTYEDINKRLGDKAKESVLPGRKCFVVSSTLSQENVQNATVIKQIYDVVNHNTDEDYLKTIFFIGGNRIFKEAISIVNTVYLTIINNDFGCDKFFPTEYIDKYFVIDTMHKVEKSPDLRFLTYIRKK